MTVRPKLKIEVSVLCCHSTIACLLIPTLCMVDILNTQKSMYRVSSRTRDSPPMPSRPIASFVWRGV